LNFGIHPPQPPHAQYSFFHSKKQFPRHDAIPSGTCLFFAIFFGVCIFVPVALLETFGVFVYGPAVGLPLTFSAAFLGNVFCFMVARSCCYSHAQSILRSFGHRSLIFERMIEKHPWKITLFIRLSLIPMAIRNYLCAALPISLTCFSVCTFAGHLPYAILYTLIGSSVGSVADLTNLKSPLAIASISIGIACCIALFIVMHIFYKRTMLELEAEDAASGGGGGSTECADTAAAVDAESTQNASKLVGLLGSDAYSQSPA
jgi:uncharacterized membrane protein YdjX (TVP38/TMEM64 family)